jgi:hypothetical protein
MPEGVEIKPKLSRKDKKADGESPDRAVKSKAGRSNGRKVFKAETVRPAGTSAETDEMLCDLAHASRCLRKSHQT